MNWLHKIAISLNLRDLIERGPNSHVTPNCIQVLKNWANSTKRLTWLMDHPQLECQLSQFLCEKVMLYTIFTSFSSWFQPCDYWNDSKAENRGQPVLEHPRPSPPAYFGSNKRGFEPFITAKTGGRLSPWCPKSGCPLISAMGSF